MKLFLIIFSALIVSIYAIPVLRYTYKRFSLIIRLNNTLKNLNLKKYGKVKFIFGKYRPFFIETYDTVYSIILFPCFFKTMLFFNFNGSMQVRRIGVRRYFPIKSYYNVPISIFDFDYHYDSLPKSCRDKKLVPILLLNPAPVDVHIPLNKKACNIDCKNIKADPMTGWIPFGRGERSTGDGELIEGFFIVGANSFLKQIKGETHIFNF